MATPSAEPQPDGAGAAARLVGQVAGDQVVHCRGREVAPGELEFAAAGVVPGPKEGPPATSNRPRDGPGEKRLNAPKTYSGPIGTLLDLGLLSDYMIASRDW